MENKFILIRYEENGRNMVAIFNAGKITPEDVLYAIEAGEKRKHLIKLTEAEYDSLKELFGVEIIELE